MKKQLGVISVITLLVVTLFTLSAFASDAQVYLSSDRNGQTRVTNIQEGDAVFIVVIDGDENIDCDVRDKFWTDLKVFDPKTGAYIDWISFGPAAAPVAGYTGRDGSTVPVGGVIGHFFEETGASTDIFVSNVSFQIGRRINWTLPQGNTHWVGFDFDGFDNLGVALHTWQGDWTYRAGVRVNLNILMPVAPIAPFLGALEGRFENMDTLIIMYHDQNDRTDVAVGMAKIIDTEGKIEWDQEIYKDANASATITVTDPDENLNCNVIEYVPVFVIVNPGSWNPLDGPNGASANDFCSLRLNGGVAPLPAAPAAGPAALSPVRAAVITWFNIYNSGSTALGVSLNLATPAPIAAQPDEDGSYYIQYPNNNNIVAGISDGRGAIFDTRTFNGETRVSFYAQETSVNSGIFQLNLNQILLDLGFNSLAVRDVLVAYYLDPNDEDDFKLATAYIEERQHSITSFTDAGRVDKDVFWIGRDPVYVQVIDSNANVDPCCPEQVVVKLCDPHDDDDAEWLILDETSSNSPVFFSNSGTVIDPVWDAMGVGIAPPATGGWQLQMDNWKLEVYNEDEVYARYNDVYYFATDSDPNGALAAPWTGPNFDGLAFLGDLALGTAWPPTIERPRVINDVSFDLMSIGDTQVYDGSSVNMYFLDRQGSSVVGYVNSDCVFIKVIDPDQDEDQYRRERIDAFWDASQNAPFGPADYELNHAVCGVNQNVFHVVNRLLGDTNIFSGPGVAVPAVPEVRGGAWAAGERAGTTRAKLYVMNPRNGHWAPVDLLETAPGSGEFVSTICIDLTSVYQCVPSLGIIPGDTLVAFYQDPSNHSDSAMISIKVGVGGGATPPAQQSTTMFVDAEGNEVANYTDADLAYVQVIDPSHAGATLLADVVEIDGVEYDVTPFGAADTFITAGLDLGLVAGDTITATYVDPMNPTDTSEDTITVIASVLMIDSFYAGPNPFDAEVTFGFNGTGIATMMSVAIYDLAGGLVWETTLADVSEITWDGAGLANGAYIYVITATDGTSTYTDTGKVFINR